MYSLVSDFFSSIFNKSIQFNPSFSNSLQHSYIKKNTIFKIGRIEHVYCILDKLDPTWQSYHMNFFEVCFILIKL